MKTLGWEGGVRKVRKFGSKRRSRAGVKKTFWDVFCASKREVFGMKTLGWQLGKEGREV